MVPWGRRGGKGEDQASGLGRSFANSWSRNWDEHLARNQTGFQVTLCNSGETSGKVCTPPQSPFPQHAVLKSLSQQRLLIVAVLWQAPYQECPSYQEHPLSGLGPKDVLGGRAPLYRGGHMRLSEVTKPGSDENQLHIQACVLLIPSGSGLSPGVPW